MYLCFYLKMIPKHGSLHVAGIKWNHILVLCIDLVYSTEELCLSPDRSHTEMHNRMQSLEIWHIGICLYLVGISWYKMLYISRQILGWSTSQLQSRPDIQAKDRWKWAIAHRRGHSAGRSWPVHYTGNFWTAEPSAISSRKLCRSGLAIRKLTSVTDARKHVTYCPAQKRWRGDRQVDRPGRDHYHSTVLSGTHSASSLEL